jgi:hypothetical protein
MMVLTQPMMSQGNLYLKSHGFKCSSHEMFLLWPRARHNTSHSVGYCRRYSDVSLILQALLNYTAGLDIPGAVLIFLPGWNLIFAIHKFLTQHPVFGKTLSILLETVPA